MGFLKGKGSWLWAGAGIILVVVVLCGFWAATLYLQYLKVFEVGSQYTNVFFTDIKIRILVQAAVFLCIFALFYLGNLWLKRNLTHWDPGALFLHNKLWVFVVTLILSFIGASFIGENVYNRVLPAFNPTWFNTADPIFGLNIGYYVFVRPLFMAIIDGLLGVLVFYTIYSAALYLIYYIRDGAPHPSELLKQRGIIVHLAISVILCFIVSSFKFRFLAEDILFYQKGDMAGGGYTDITIWLNFYRIAPILLIVIAGLSIYFLLRGQIKSLGATVLAYPIMWLIAGAVAASVQTLVVKPNGVSQEKQFIQYNIENTRTAYNINGMEEAEYPLNDDLKPSDLKENADTVNNIRITDIAATITALNQLQTFRNYYQFKDADIVPYDINGQKRAVYIAARELSKDESTDKAKMTYVNRHMRYTHGYGAVMMPVNEVTNEGQPRLFIKNMPIVSTDGAPEIKEPRIYFGENSEDFAIVNSTQKELDYLEGQNELEFSYKGRAGIGLNMLNRLLFAFNNGDINILTSNYITPESKILINRNVIERVKTAVPFLNFDIDPYMIIDSNGKLKWVVDAYTSTKYYPYSQEIDGTNYIRNSAKAVVDAYDGTVELYITDYNDPIIKTYSKIYHGVFKNEQLPSDISMHVRYPETIFKMQAQIYKKYHTTNPSIFYAKSDVWDIAHEKSGQNNEEHAVEPYYNMMPVGYGASRELVLTLPYTIVNKDNNLVAWIAARSYGNSYGQLIAYKFPMGKHVYGTMQIENKIDNEPEISKVLPLWNQGGSSVIRGNLLVVPIKSSIVYVEPIYITSKNKASLPEIKRIVLAYGEHVVMEPTLNEAFDKLFESLKQKPVIAKPEISPTPIPEQLLEGETSELLDKVVTKYNEAKNYNKENEWEKYGKSMKELDQLIKKLEEKRSGQVR